METGAPRFDVDEKEREKEERGERSERKKPER